MAPSKIELEINEEEYMSAGKRICAPLPDIKTVMITGGAGFMYRPRSLKWSSLTACAVLHG